MSSRVFASTANIKGRLVRFFPLNRISKRRFFSTSPLFPKNTIFDSSMYTKSAAVLVLAAAGTGCVLLQHKEDENKTNSGKSNSKSKKNKLPLVPPPNLDPNVERVVIIGGGVMGLATAWRLLEQWKEDEKNQNNADTQNIKKHLTLVCASKPGSSWGEARITRMAQQTPFLCDFMRRSYEVWSDLEKVTNKEIILPVANMIFADVKNSKRANKFLKSFSDACEKNGVEFTVLEPGDGLVSYNNGNSSKDDRKKFELRQKIKNWGIKLEPNVDKALLFQNDPNKFELQSDGITKKLPADQIQSASILAEEAVGSMREIIESSQNADLFLGEAVIDIDRDNKLICTEDDRVLKYDKLVICSGAYTNSLLKIANLPLLGLMPSNEQAVYYTELNSEESENGAKSFTVENGAPNIICGIQGIKGDDSTYANVYGQPNTGPNGVKGCKFGAHQEGDRLSNKDEFIVRWRDWVYGTFVSSPKQYGFLSRFKQRDIRSDSLDKQPKIFCDNVVERYFPDMKVEKENFDSEKLSTYRCMYTNTFLTDEGKFLIGKHPACKESEEIFVVSGFAGEGFKFAAVVGDFVGWMVEGSKLDAKHGKLYSKAKELMRLERTL